MSQETIIVKEGTAKSVPYVKTTLENDYLWSWDRINELTEEAKKGLIMRMEINLHKLKLNYYNTKED